MKKQQVQPRPPIVYLFVFTKQNNVERQEYFLVFLFIQNCMAVLSQSDHFCDIWRPEIFCELWIRFLAAFRW